MDKRTTGLVATIATALLCGCPGIFLCFFGVATAIGGTTPSLDNSVPTIDLAYGYASLCLSLILIAVPFVVGAVTLRTRRDVVATVAPPVGEPTRPEPPVDDEPLPPAS